MCKCINVAMGSFSNQSKVTAPDGKIIGIDNCIVDEVKGLWDMGIITIESCCGHNLAPSYIAVDEQSIWMMKALGYKQYPEVMDEVRSEMFYAKTA